MNMFQGALAEDRTRIVEMIPGQGGTIIAEFPAGAIARAWADVHSRRLTWDDLTTWLRERSPA